MSFRIEIDRIYSVEDLAEMLQIDIRTVHKLLRNGQLRGRKLAKRWYVSGRDLEAYFAGRDPAQLRMKLEHLEAEIASLRSIGATDKDGRITDYLRRLEQNRQKLQQELGEQEAPVAEPEAAKQEAS